MKKLMLILLPLTLFLVSCGGGEGDLQPVTQSLEETLVGKKWCLSNEDEDGFKLSQNGDFMITQKCNPNDWQGHWIIEDSLIKYFYTQNSIQTTVLWGQVTEYSATEVKILIYSDETTTVVMVYSLTPEDVYGCTDIKATNYNSLATCEDFSCNYQMTYIPDNNFEQYLINEGIDDLLDDSVKTYLINSLITLNVGNKGISDLTGIENFTALKYLTCHSNQLTNLDLSNNTALNELYCSNNQLTSLDISTNTALEYVYCHNNQLTSLDLSTNTALVYIDCSNNQLTSLDFPISTAFETLFCSNNQLTSLDLSNNTALNELYCSNNQLTSLDLSTNTALYFINCIDNPYLTCIEVDNAAWSTANWTNIDPQHYFSEDCP